MERVLKVPRIISAYRKKIIHTNTQHADSRNPYFKANSFFWYEILCINFNYLSKWTVRAFFASRILLLPMMKPNNGTNGKFWIDSSKFRFIVENKQIWNNDFNIIQNKFELISSQVFLPINQFISRRCVIEKREHLCWFFIYRIKFEHLSGQTCFHFFPTTKSPIQSRQPNVMHKFF